jgi:hypothetical protein
VDWEQKIDANDIEDQNTGILNKEFMLIAERLLDSTVKDMRWPSCHPSMIGCTGIVLVLCSEMICLTVRTSTKEMSDGMDR